MSTPEERIAELARKNAVSPADAAKLLAAVKTTPVTRGSWNLLDRVGTPALLGIAIVTALLSLGLARLGVHFPGFIDASWIQHPVPWLTAAIEQLIVFPISAAVFYGVGRIVSPRVRYVDMLVTVGPARLPMVLSILPVALAKIDVLAALALVGLAFQITFLVIGFRTATGARGKSLVFGVIGAMFAAELLAKLVVYFVP